MKNDTFKIHDTAGWTIFIFGVLAFLLGLAGLIKPEILLTILGFDVAERASRAASDYTLIFLTASSMASLNIGVYYVLAALNNVRIFYGWTVPFRMLTFVIFSLVIFSGLAPIKFMGVAAWELTGALATGAALYFEKKKVSK